jgi:hypothetical protein
MSNDVRFDISKWITKTDAVKKAFAKAAAQTLQAGAQQIYDDARANLKGPGIPMRTNKKGKQYPRYDLRPDYSTKEMPIARVTSMLAQSLTLSKLNDLTYAVWADKDKAIHSRMIHEGNKKGRPPRRFIGDPAKLRGPKIKKQLEKNIMNAITSEGQK